MHRSDEKTMDEVAALHRDYKLVEAFVRENAGVSGGLSDIALKALSEAAVKIEVASKERMRALLQSSTFGTAQVMDFQPKTIAGGSQNGAKVAG